MSNKKTITTDGFLTKTQQKALAAPLVWCLVLISQLIVGALIAWQILAQTHFAYPLAYDALAIDEHITRFAPKNRFRPHFETTDKEQHLQLFAEIGEAIQDHGNGLADITYVTSTGRKIQLLRKAEVIHLQDVANLVDFFYLVAGISVVVLLVSLVTAWKLSLRFPGVKAIALGIVAVIAAVSLPLLVIGPKKVFYWLHVQIFPPEHEWFFYYQESLMTTLMKAPDLFGFIGALLGVLGLVFWLVQIVAVRWYFQKHMVANGKGAEKSTSKGTGKRSHQ